MGRADLSALHPRRWLGCLDGETRLLAVVMWLPLVDGVFVAIVLAGGLDRPAGIAQVGLLIFGGSAVLAVVLANVGRSLAARFRSIGAIGVPLVLGAGLVALLAPTIGSILDVGTFEWFAAIVIAVIAVDTASERLGEHLPRPGAIVGIGLLVSLRPQGLELAIHVEPSLVLAAMAAAAIGVAFAFLAVAVVPTLRHLIVVERLRLGCGLALGVLALAIVDLAPVGAPIPVLVVAAVVALDPGAVREGIIRSSTNAVLRERLGSIPKQVPRKVDPERTRS